jgi:alkylhydroperoxidase family enzyme
MSNPLLHVPWDTCLLEPVHDRALKRQLKREAGGAPAWSRYFWSSPWFAKAAIRLEWSNGVLLVLDFDVAVLVALVVSRENSCRYCYATVRAMMRMLGLDEARVQAIEAELAGGRLDARRDAVVQFARAVNRGHGLDGRAMRERLLLAGFTPDEVREVAYVVVAMGFMNRMTTIAALSPTTWELTPDRWIVRLLQPVLPPLIKRMMKRGQPRAQPAGDSPLSTRLLACYEGSPIQSILADSVRDLWASEGLPQRTKLLMLTTIAQGISCAVCTGEVARLAAAAGFEFEALDRTAAHLDDPGLEATERELCEFARESLWYEPLKIQRKGRAICARIGQPAFVEALAVAAFGNLLMRLTAAMVDPE